MKKIMETKKRKYVKPKLTVAEWDFNEAVCQDNTMLLSKCVISESGTLNRYVTVENDAEWNGPEWKDFPSR